MNPHKQQVNEVKTMRSDRLLYYYILFPDGYNCGHKHRNENGAKRCCIGYQKYYPGAIIIAKWKTCYKTDKIARIK